MNARKLKYLVGAAADSLWQYRGRNVFSIAIICLSFLIVGVFLSLANNLQYIARQFSPDMVVTFYLQKNAATADVKELERRVRASPLVAGVGIVPPATALERFRRDFPDLNDILDNLASNPFPISLEARLKSTVKSSGTIAAFVREVRAAKGVADAQYNRDWIGRMQSLSWLVRAVGFFLGGILVLASFFIISNVIKLSVLAGKNEIEILRLVGATDLFIRVPFLLEGMVLGILGSLASLAFLYLAVQLFPVFVGSLGLLKQVLSLRYLSPAQSIGLIAAGAAIGILGSANAVSRFLKI